MPQVSVNIIETALSNFTHTVNGLPAANMMSHPKQAKATSQGSLINTTDRIRQKGIIDPNGQSIRMIKSIRVVKSICLRKVTLI